MVRLKEYLPSEYLPKHQTIFLILQFILNKRKEKVKMCEMNFQGACISFISTSQRINIYAEGLMSFYYEVLAF